MVFIAFEGGEGTGKSTQMKRVASWLRDKGVATLESREPGGSPLSEKIRTLFKEVPSHGDAPLPMTELMLVMAARSQHFEKTIRPAMTTHQTWILCDRFLDSTYVYQGSIGGVEKRVIDSVAKLVIGNFTPDLTLVFSVPETVASKRRDTRVGEQPGQGDRLDELHTDVHAKIDAAFRLLVEDATAYPSGKAPVRILIDSAADVESVFESVQAALTQTFPQLT